MKMLHVWMGIALTVLLVAGCGGNSVPTAAVSGKVTLDGDPLAGVEVNFFSKEHKFAGIATTNSDGTFTLVSGAGVGPNQVYFTKPVELAAEGGFSDDPESGMDAGQLAAMEGTGAEPVATVESGPVIPEAFGSAEKSKLSFNVPAGGTTSADFNLTTPK